MRRRHLLHGLLLGPWWLGGVVPRTAWAHAAALSNLQLSRGEGALLLGRLRLLGLPAAHQVVGEHQVAGVGVDQLDVHLQLAGLETRTHLGFIERPAPLPVNDYVEVSHRFARRVGVHYRH